MAGRSEALSQFGIDELVDEEPRRGNPEREQQANPRRQRDDPRKPDPDRERRKPLGERHALCSIRNC
jgi:hypothetical protein